MSRRPIDGDALADYIEHFRKRVLQDPLAEATAAYWRRRAATFQWARPKPGDFTGLATADELAERDARLAEIVLACNSRAAVSLIGGVTGE